MARSGPSGELQTLSVPLTDKDVMWVIERRGKHFATREQTMELEPQTIVRSGEISNSWIDATAAAGIPEAVASQLMAIFGSEIDFHRDLRKGDHFSLVYKVFNRHGQTVRYGRILAAEIRRHQKALQAFWFQPERSGGAYTWRTVTASARPFCAPQSSYRRSIWVLQEDACTRSCQPGEPTKTWITAPRGTAVLAVAGGIVDTAEHQNNGYGNLIVIKHHGAYSSAYGHLSNFAAGLRKDTRVRQGDTIGYVGQTGLATGPHLHYEFRVNDEQVDPLKLALPTSMPLEGLERGRYLNSSMALRTQLERAGEMILAAVE